MALIVTVEMLEGDRHDARIILADQVAFENTARTRNWGGIADNQLTFMAFVAWKSMTRTGAFNGTFDEFQLAVSHIEEHTEEEGLDPTEAVQLA